MATRRTFLAFATLCLLAVSSAGRAQTIDALLQAADKGDAKAVAGFWTPDGDYVDQLGSVIKGRAAIEKLYNVKVVAVRTVNVAGKPQRTRSGEKTTAAWKKAIVQLHPDHKIDLF